MFLSKIAAFASVGLFALTAGCAAESASSEDGVSSQAALANPAEEGSFKLYASARPERDTQCDVYTQLDLTHPSMQGNLVADLYVTVDGACRIALPADDRQYRLVLASVECGSHVYKGTALVAGEKREVTITDHRTRFCRDFVPAQIVVEEHPASSDARTLYSYDTLVAAQ